MITHIKQDAESRMQKCLDSLKIELGKLRTGRANPVLLDGIMVSYYGNNTPLNQIANINVEDARTLSVSPWEKTMVPEIEKAIISSNLGLNPVTTGAVIRIPLPPLTEERRKDLLKLVKSEGENARIAVRNVRRDANGQLKSQLKDKALTEDEDRQGQELIQKSTDRFIAEVEKMLSEKEVDMMAM